MKEGLKDREDSECVNDDDDDKYSDKDDDVSPIIIKRVTDDSPGEEEKQTSTTAVSSTQSGKLVGDHQAGLKQHQSTIEDSKSRQQASKS